MNISDCYIIVPLYCMLVLQLIILYVDVMKTLNRLNENVSSKIMIEIRSFVNIFLISNIYSGIY